MLIVGSEENKKKLDYYKSDILNYLIKEFKINQPIALSIDTEPDLPF